MTERIGIGPLTAELCDPAELQALDDRARALGVIVSTRVRGTRHRTYLVTVHDYGTRRVRLEGQGRLEAVIAGALDDWVEVAA